MSEQIMPKNVFPFDMDIAEDVAFYLELIQHQRGTLINYAFSLHKKAEQMDPNTASICGVYKSVLNIQKAEAQLTCFLQMAYFAAEQIQADLEDIRKEYNEAKRQYNLRMIQEQAFAKEEQKRKADRERIAEKRAADPEIQRIADHRYSRPNKRPAE